MNEETSRLLKNDYVVLSRGQDNCLPPHLLILDVTVTHDRYGRHEFPFHTNRNLTHTVSSSGSPHPDGTLKKVVRKKIIHYSRLYTDLWLENYRKFWSIFFSSCCLVGSPYVSVGLTLSRVSVMRILFPSTYLHVPSHLPLVSFVLVDPPLSLTLP